MNEARKLPIADGRQTWHEVWRISRGHRLALVAIVALGLASAAAGLVVPAAIGHLVDRVRDGSAGTGTILWAMLAMTLASVLASAGTAGTIVLTGRAYHAMLAKLREKLIERAMALPQGLVERAGTGDLVSRSSDDVSQIADAAPRIIPAFTTVLFTIIATFAGMAALDPWYALAMVAILPVYILTLRWYLATAPGIYQAQRAAMGGRAQQVLESQRAHATVVGLGLTERRHHLVLDASWGWSHRRYGRGRCRTCSSAGSTSPNSSAWARSSSWASGRSAGANPVSGRQRRRCCSSCASSAPSTSC